MRDETNLGPGLRGQRLEQRLERLLALRERHWSQVLPAQEQQVEREQDEGILIVGRQCGLQPREAGMALVIEHGDLAIDEGVRQLAGGCGDRREFRRPVQSRTGFERRDSVRDAQLHAVAVQFHLVAPALAGRRPVDEAGELRLDEVGDRALAP